MVTRSLTCYCTYSSTTSSNYLEHQQAFACSYVHFSEDSTETSNSGVHVHITVALVTCTKAFTSHDVQRCSKCLSISIRFFSLCWRLDLTWHCILQRIQSHYRGSIRCSLRWRSLVRCGLFSTGSGTCPQAQITRVESR